MTITVPAVHPFIHPVQRPIRRLPGENDPIMSPMDWAIFKGLPITDAVEVAERQYRRKFGGGFRRCETPVGRARCRCGAYRLLWEGATISLRAEEAAREDDHGRDEAG